MLNLGSELRAFHYNTSLVRSCGRHSCLGLLHSPLEFHPGSHTSVSARSRSHQPLISVPRVSRLLRLRFDTSFARSHRLLVIVHCFGTSSLVANPGTMSSRSVHARRSRQSIPAAIAALTSVPRALANLNDLVRSRAVSTVHTRSLSLTRSNSQGYSIEGGVSNVRIYRSA